MAVVLNMIFWLSRETECGLMKPLSVEAQSDSSTLTVLIKRECSLPAGPVRQKPVEPEKMSAETVCSGSLHLRKLQCLRDSKRVSLFLVGHSSCAPPHHSQIRYTERHSTKTIHLKHSLIPSPPPPPPPPPSLHLLCFCPVLNNLYNGLRYLMNPMGAGIGLSDVLLWILQQGAPKEWNHVLPFHTINGYHF